MASTVGLPIQISIKGDIEYRENRATPYRARVRWIDPSTKKRRSLSEAFPSPDAAQEWINTLVEAGSYGVDPSAATQHLGDYGEHVKHLALRGLEKKTTDPYLAGWKKRVVPTIGHIPIRMITNGVVDRAVHSWITEGCSKSTIKNTIAMLTRILDQAVRDGLIDRNPAHVPGWQNEYKLAEDELDDPRSLALPDWGTLIKLAEALVQNSGDKNGKHCYSGWGDVIIFAASTAARIGEVSGCRVGDIDLETWTWTVRRQTTPGPGGLVDKATKGKRARVVPLIQEVRPMVARLVAEAGTDPMARLFRGPRGGRITTAVLRDATRLSR